MICDSSIHLFNFNFDLIMMATQFQFWKILIENADDFANWLYLVSIIVGANSTENRLVAKS